MAQQHPMIGGKLEPMDNVTYDLVTELSSCGQAVDALDTYIEDAQKANNPDVTRLFEQIRDDEIRHCDMLRSLISKQVKEGKF